MHINIIIKEIPQFWTLLQINLDKIIKLLCQVLYCRGLPNLTRTTYYERLMSCTIFPLK